jgi:hypothetical protein
MATRAKYTRAESNNEGNEPKLDTDILMRFSDRYGTPFPTQANTSLGHSPCSSERASLS